MFTEIKIELSKFDWSGVSGLSDVVMVLLTLVLLAGLKQGAKNIRESSISRDADILRWAMSEMDTLKPQIRLLTDAHKRHNYCGLPHDPETNPNGWTEPPRVSRRLHLLRNWSHYAKATEVFP